jgi:poly-beta-1,6-N-acetyl-D-glucosamine N-deacetylase
MSAPTLLPRPEPPAPPRRTRFGGVLGTLLLLAIVAGYLVVPAVWQWNTAADHYGSIRGQVAAPAVPPTPDDLRAAMAAAPTSVQGGPIMLTYHDIGYNPSPYTVTPEQFAEQMQLLADAGWRTGGLDDLAAWLRGTPMPPHTVVVTFDDGAAGVWQYADPILAAHGQHAVAFVITGFLSSRGPYYLSWEEVQAMQRSGRWDIGSHTHEGHVQVPTDDHGGQGPYLTSREYLADRGRLETDDEYATRVRTDLEESKAQLVAHGVPEPRFFAYPFSAYDGTAPAGVLAGIVGSLFEASMLDDAVGPQTTTTSDLANLNLARMDITADESLSAWTAKVVGASPLDPADSRPFARPDDWTSSDETGARLLVQNGETVVDPGPGAYAARRFAPAQTRLWRRYTVEADVAGFARTDDGATTGLVVLAGDPQQIDIAVAASDFQISQAGGDARTLVASGPLRQAPTHHVSVRVEPEAVTVVIDGRPAQVVPLVAAAHGFGPAGGIGISGNRYDDESPVPLVRNLTVGAG